jgi:thymidylate synthase
MVVGSISGEKMNDFTVISNEDAILFNKWKEQQSKTHEEYQYLNLMKDILDKGQVKGDRTGTGTKSIFGTQMRFSLTNQFPILTTKKVYWKGVVEELLWFIRGETNSKKLEEKNVNIWKGNTSREFLDKKGLNYPEGFIGPGYGWQWRHWGGQYNIRALQTTFTEDGERLYIQQCGQSSPGVYGVDQLQQIVDTLKTNPNDRRMILSAWNVAEIDKMALPPCHLLAQFYVSNGALSCMWTQRSVDTLLGLPFNISSYALLTYLLAEITGYVPGDLIFSGGDTHLYNNHVDQANEQLTRVPYPFPKLKIKKKITSLKDIEALEFSDFELLDYQSHASIKAPMAV